MATADRIAVADTQLWVQRSGTDVGRTVVLIHGMACDLRVWDRVYGDFSTQARVVRYDLRGYGRSPVPSATTGPYTHAGDLATLLDALHIASATVVGHSMGGRIALDFAVHHPDRVDGLALISPVVHGMPPSTDTDDAMDRVTRALAKSGPVAAAAALLAEHRRVFGLDADAVELASAMVGDYSFWHFSHPHREQVIVPTTYERLPEIAVPTVVLAGADEHPDLLDAAREIERLVPGATLSLVSGAGHWLPIARPERVSKAISALMSG